MANAPRPGIGARLEAQAVAEQLPRQVWAFRFTDDDVVEVRELSVDTITRIARQNGVNWQTVINTPGADLGVLSDLLRAAAVDLDVPLTLGASAKEVVRAGNDYLALVDDDLPPMPEASEATEENPTDANLTAG